MNLPELLGFRSELQVTHNKVKIKQIISTSSSVHHHNPMMAVCKVMKRAGDKVDAGIAALLAFLGILLYSARFIIIIIIVSLGRFIIIDTDSV